MGLFDGGEGSAAHLAKTLELPVFLVIDVRSAAESVAAVAHGFATLDPGLRLAGVICNRVGSDKHRQMIADAIATYCEVPVLGYLPRNEAVSIPSRHLGLHMGEEHPLKGEGLEKLVNLIEEHLDLERMLEIARQRPAQMSPAPIAPLVEAGAPVRIGVARDAAFCFYYEDNLDLLREAGAELIFFSPLRDERVYRRIFRDCILAVAIRSCMRGHHQWQCEFARKRSLPFAQGWSSAVCRMRRLHVPLPIDHRPGRRPVSHGGALPVLNARMQPRLRSPGLPPAHGRSRLPPCLPGARCSMVTNFTTPPSRKGRQPQLLTIWPMGAERVF